jgi:sRNA-binding protein
VSPAYPTATAAMLVWLPRLTGLLPEDVVVFPRAVGQPVLPLAIGTAKRLEELGVPTDIVTEIVRGYTKHPAYLRALALPGAMRHDLAGQPVEPVTAGHAHVAALALENRRRRRDEETARRVAAVRDAALAARTTTTEPEPMPEPVVAVTEPEQAHRTKPTLTLGTRLSPDEIERRLMAARGGIGERKIRARV